MYSKVFGLKNRDGYDKVNTRKAVRGLIYQDKYFLLLQTNLGDYKLPGGGIEKGESPQEALKREVAEETGYKVLSVGAPIARVLQRRPDSFNDRELFEMESTFYVCDIADEQCAQDLDDYEKELDFQVKWVTLDEAITQNDRILERRVQPINPWVEREVHMFKRFKESLNM